MKDLGRLLWLALGLLLGGGAAVFYFSAMGPAEAANDRSEEYTMATGPVNLDPKNPMDGIWLLDYKTGRLLATVVNLKTGKLTPWSELDLVAEFAAQPGQKVHFMMTTGQVAPSQAALYLVETTTGKVGVYTLGPRPNGNPGVLIRRHDFNSLR
jgi:hypothetical protein